MAVQVQAPRGTTLSDGKQVWVEVDADLRRLKLAETPVPVGPAAAELDRELDLPGRSAVKLVFPLRGQAPATAQVIQEQSFADDILVRPKPGKPVRLGVAIDDADPSDATAAYLKLAVEHLGPGQGWAVLNGRRIALPQGSAILEVPIDPGLVEAENTLTFECASWSPNGYLVEMASIVVEREGE